MSEERKEPYSRPPFKKMTGMKWADMKKHPALVPLFACLGVGFVICIAMSTRSLTKHPDVTWNKWTHSDPWEDYRHKNFKFYTSQKQKEYVKTVDPPQYEDK